MTQSDLETRAGRAAARQPGTTTAADDFGHLLEELFAEVAWLCNRLKRSSALPRGQAKPGETARPAGERSVLRILGRKGAQTVPQIARVRGTSRQSVQTLVNRLAAQGWVALAGNPAHKRSDLVRLTERGQILQATLAESEAKFMEFLSPHVSAPGLVSAVALLRRLRQQIADQEQVQPRGEVRKAGWKREKRKAESEKAGTTAPIMAESGPALPIAAAAEEEQENQLPVNLL